MEPELAQPAASPNPVAGYRINHRRNDHGIDAICRELGALRHGTGNDCSGSCAEYGLEDQRRPVIALADHAIGEEIKSAEERACRPKHDAKPENPENRRAERKVHQVFHDDIACIFRTGEAGLDHCKARLHKKDERRSDQRPADVNRRRKVVDIHYRTPLKMDGVYPLPADAGQEYTPLCMIDIFTHEVRKIGTPVIRRTAYRRRSGTASTFCQPAFPVHPQSRAPLPLPQ